MDARYLTLLIAVAVFWPRPGTADEVRYYTENGVTYRETRRLVQRPVAETRDQQSVQTVYREQWTTEQREYCRVSWLPVTEYRYETYWAGRFNPFVTPYLAARYVPYTRWEMKTEKITLPVHIRKVTPQTQTVTTPVTTTRYVTEELVDRVPVGPMSGGTQLAGPPVMSLAPVANFSPPPAMATTTTTAPGPVYAAPAPAYGANHGLTNAAAAPPNALGAPATPPVTSPAPASALQPVQPVQPQTSPYTPPGGFMPSWNAAPAVSAPSAAAPAPAAAARQPVQIGGISRLEQDPPRYGWRPTGSSMR